VALAQLLPLLIAVHVALAVSLFLPSILLPFALRLRRGQWQEQPGRVSRVLFWLQRNGTLVIGAGLAVTGTLMLLILGPQLLTQPWLLIAGDLRREPAAGVLRPTACAGQAARHAPARVRCRARPLARMGASAALRQLRDGWPRGPDRVSDVEQARVLRARRI
jgi:hypothetical protein